jgi:alpha 1,2-mannosyltransferase
MRGPGRTGLVALAVTLVVSVLVLWQVSSGGGFGTPLLLLEQQQESARHELTRQEVNMRTMRALWAAYGQIYGNITGNQPVEVVASASASVPPESRKRARRNYRAFLEAVPKFGEVKDAFHGRGIVIAGGGYQMDYVYFTVKTIRKLKCNLPIELWVCSGRGEMPSGAEVEILHTLGVSVHDVDAVAAVFPEMNRQLHSTKPGDKPYIIKQIALISSSCKECLLLDADNTPLRNPEFLFEDENYLTHRMVLWPDFWHMRPGPASIREIFGLPQGYDKLPDERTVESGQMILDKERAWSALMLSVWMQLQTEYFDNQMRALHHLGGGGDKQTFLISCLATNTSCWMIPTPVASSGVIKKSNSFCGRSMVQVACVCVCVGGAGGGRGCRWKVIGGL